MGYFANGSEWRAFEASSCSRCANARDTGDGLVPCHIADMHELLAGTASEPGLVQIGDSAVHGPTVQMMLNELINPAGVCVLFRARGETALEDAGQMSILDRFDLQHGERAHA